MPTSVLLAVLAAAALLALAPALTRRYDATERVAAERATSTARVLTRRRRRRTVPGPRPINPPRFMGGLHGSPGSPASSTVRTNPARSTSVQDRATRTGGGRAAATGSGRARSGPVGSGVVRQPVRSRASSIRATHVKVSRTLRRKRRVLLALVMLNAVELAGVVLVGPGFWISFAVTFVALVADLVYLRRQAVAVARMRRIRQRRSRWVAQQQAAVRREHDRRAAERAATTRRLAYERDEARREAARQATEYVERYEPRTARGS